MFSFVLMQELHGVATAHKAVLVLHGASGVATDLVKVISISNIGEFVIQSILNLSPQMVKSDRLHIWRS